MNIMMQRGRDFQYNINFSRRRTISITVSPDKGVIVKAPYRTSVASIDRFVEQKSEWIRKALDGFRSLKRIDDNAGYSDGNEVLLFGRNFLLKVVHSTKNYIRILPGDIIEAGCINDKNPEFLQSRMEMWYRKIAREKLTLKFRELLERYTDYNFRPTDFVVRMMKKRWGSCSSKGKIAISYDLIRLDDIFGEYVIIHELCHLKHHNHGKDFYKLLSELFPGWKKVRKDLQMYIR